MDIVISKSTEEDGRKVCSVICGSAPITQERDEASWFNLTGDSWEQTCHEYARAAFHQFNGAARLVVREAKMVNGRIESREMVLCSK